MNYAFEFERARLHWLIVLRHRNLSYQDHIDYASAKRGKVTDDVKVFKEIKFQIFKMREIGINPLFNDYDLTVRVIK